MFPTYSAGLVDDAAREELVQDGDVCDRAAGAELRRIPGQSRRSRGNGETVQRFLIGVFGKVRFVCKPAPSRFSRMPLAAAPFFSNF